MRSIPGVSVVDRGDRNSSVVNGIRIRGLNVDSSALGDYAVSAAATVSTYVNDTPIFANFLLTDIERVEVLKGPQGTLYGSGALGGTVRYILNAPRLDKFSARVERVRYPTWMARTASASQDRARVNLPLGDTLALRVTARDNDYPGVTDYVNLYQLDSTEPGRAKRHPQRCGLLPRKKDADFAHQNYGRAALLWKPSDNFDATATFTEPVRQFRRPARHHARHRRHRRAVQGLTGGIGPARTGSPQRLSRRRSRRTSIWVSATLTSSTSYYNHHGEITSENTGFYAQNGWLGELLLQLSAPDGLGGAHLR